MCNFILGQSYERVRKVYEYAGLGFPNPTTYYDIQRSLVLPTINDHYQENIQLARNESRNIDTVVLGDGRFDSPGKSAKYCTYTCQSPSTKKIIVSSTIQTVKGKGSSPLELKGLQNCLGELSADKYPVKTVATDRNRQVAKWLREEHSEITHKYDPWHFAKNIKSKLRPLSMRKSCKLLQEWIKPVGSHLFWCAENCDDDPQKLVQMWKSLLFHVTNKYNFKGMHPIYPKCLHRPYTRE